MIEKIKTVFRPIYVPVLGKYNHWKLERSFVKSLGKMLKNTAFIIGSPVYSNLGDSAIFLAQNQMIENSGWRTKELTYREFYDLHNSVRRIIKKHNPIFGMGGGNMGNQWPAEERIRIDIIHEFPENPIIIFPQTLYFVGDSEAAIKDSKALYNSHRDLTIVAREQKSFELMTDYFPNAKLLLTPDIVLSTTMEDYGVIPETRSGVLFVTRSDPEKAVSDSTWEALEKVAAEAGKACRYTDMYSEIPVTKENRAECVLKKMQEFCGAELVITDRLHGMVFAALTGTPCIVFSNYNHKVKGTYDWISYLPYIRYVETVEEAEAAIPELLKMMDCHYDNTPMMPYFDELAKVVKENANNNRYRPRL